MDPRQIAFAFTRPRDACWRRRHSGLVKDGDWDQARRNVETGRKYRACVAHFVDGKSWEETGIVDELMEEIARNGIYDGCRTRDDLLRRYDRIDLLYEDIARTRRIEPVSTRPERLRREHGGVFVHIARDGLPLLGGDGNHRLAIARILELVSIPAQVGVVHRRAMDLGLLAPMRAPALPA